MSPVVVSPFRSLRVRDFRMLSIGSFVSVVGTWMQTVAQSWLLLRLTGSPAALGALVAVAAAPQVLGGLWGGVLADRLPKRRTLMVTQTLFAVLTVAFAAMVAADLVRVWMIYAFALATGVLAVVDGPTAGAFSAQLVERDDLANAGAIGSALNSLGRVIGMAAGGTVVALWGVEAVFLLNGLSFLAVVAALRAIRRPDVVAVGAGGAGGGRDVRRELVEGLRFVAGHPELPAVLLLGAALSCFGRNYQVTMAAMTESVFHAGAGAYALCSTLFALGALAGAVVSASLPRPALRALVMAAGGSAGAQIAAGMAPGVRSFAMIVVPIAVGAVVIDTVLGARVQLAADDHVRGRVLSVLGLVGMASSAVGGLFLGALAEWLGARVSLVAGGTLALGATVLFVTHVTARRSDVGALRAA